jgi:PRC-barrel domain
MSGAASNPAKDETPQLISSDKVEGTAVYNTAGAHLGSIYNLMIDKESGRVAYAVMSFGGILGIGSDYHPLPWDQLTYDRRQNGYVVNLTRQQLVKAPAYSASEAGLWDDPAYPRGIDLYYGSFVP